MADDLLLLREPNSAALREAIELCVKRPPTKEEGMQFDREAAENATANDLVWFHDLEKNGVKTYSKWPDRNGVGQSAYKPFGNHSPTDWSTAKDKHFVVNLQSDLHKAYSNAMGQSSRLNDWQHFDSALKQVENDFKAKNKHDANKLIPRTVLFLFQLLATAIT